MTNGGMMVPEPGRASDAVKALVVELTAKVDTLAREAEGLTIKDADTRAAAGNLNAILGTVEKTGEARLKEAFAPLKDFERGVRALVSPLLDKVKMVRDGLKRKIAADVEAQEREARKIAEKANAQAAKQFARDTVKAEKKGEDAPPPPPKVEVVVSSKVGATTIRKVVDYKVKDIHSIPAEYLEVKRGDLLRALAGLVPDDATEDKPVVVLGVLAYKKVSV